MKIVTVIGTRPEAIKMVPIIKLMQEDDFFDHILCVSSQHEHMLDQVLSLFGIKPDIRIEPQPQSRTLANFFSYTLDKIDEIFSNINPDAVMVHGDTSTTLSSALAAYYHKKKLIHIEAGLRTKNIYSPWPEEINRKLTASLTHFHFAPTDKAQENLVQEGVDKNSIWVVGNSVIDALLLTADKLNSNKKLYNQCEEKFSYLNHEKKLILVTGHRRENFGEGLKNICSALLTLSERKDIEILYPVHLNPAVQEQVKQTLSKKNNIHLIDPVDYLEMVFLMKQSYLILTDSGGMQEEAPSLGKPVLVLRNTTERPEAITSGTAKLVGTERTLIVEEVISLLENPEKYMDIANINNPFGEGNASEQILAVLRENFN